MLTGPATRLNSNSDVVADAVVAAAVVVDTALNAFLWRGLHSLAVGCRLTARPEILPLL